MKKLWKSTFKSMTKNKVVLILLALIVFVTSGTFTLIQSTSSEFAKSYDRVVNQGNIHDFTIKEKFSTNGSVAMKSEKVSGSDKTQVIPDVDKSLVWQKDTGKQYFLIPATASPIQIEGKDVSFMKNWHDLDVLKSDGTKGSLEDFKTPLSLDMRIPVDNIKPIDSDGDGTIDDIQLIYEKGKDPKDGSEVNVFPVQVFTPRGSIDKWITKADLPLAYESASTSLLKGSRDSQWTTIYLPENVASADLNIMSILNDPQYAYKRKGMDQYADQDLRAAFPHPETTKQLYLFDMTDDGWSTIKLTTKQSGSAMKTSLLTMFKAESIFKSQITSSIKVSPDIDFADETNSNISGDFYKYLKTLHDTNPTLYESTYVKVLPDQLFIESTKDRDGHTVAIQPTNVNITNEKKSLKELAYKNIREKARSDFQDHIYNTYKDKISFKHVEGITVTGDSKTYKIIKNNPSTYTDKTVIFQGRNVDAPNYAGLGTKAQAYANNLPSGSFDHLEDLGWKVIVHKKGTTITPPPTSFIDPTSMQVVVSPSYAKRNGIVPISESILHSTVFQNLINDASEENMMKFHAAYPKSTIQANALTFVVVGIGVTPDFAYPIIDQKHPIPDIKNEALLYVNASGYSRVAESFRDNLKESYYAGKFYPGVSKAEQARIKSEIEVFTKNAMSWPSNIKILRDYDDITEKVIMAPHRITFLEKLNKSIRTISILITTLLVVLSSLIVTLIIKRNVSKQRKTLAILNANGYTKNEIALSYISIGTSIVIISTLLGYLVGHSLQFLMFRIFDNFWTIPTSKHAFSWVALLVTVAAPMGGVAVLSYIFSIWELRGSVTGNMAGSRRSIGHWISAKSLTRMHWVGIKTKLATSFFLTNLSKALLIFVATGGAVTASSMAFTMLGKFDYAVKKTDEVNNYRFSIDMVTPTEEGGQYLPVIPYDPTKEIVVNGENLQYIQRKWGRTRPARYWMGLENDGTSATRGHIIHSGTNHSPIISSYHSPSASDMSVTEKGIGMGGGWGEYENEAAPRPKYYQAIDEVVHYLKNRVQFKGLLNVRLGGSMFGRTNPWETAEAIMPSNQLADANNDFVVWIEKAMKSPSNIPVMDAASKEIVGSLIKGVDLDGSDGDTMEDDLILDTDEGYIWTPDVWTKHGEFSPSTAKEKAVDVTPTGSRMKVWRMKDGTTIPSGTPAGASIHLYHPGDDPTLYATLAGKVSSENQKWQFIKQLKTIVQDHKEGHLVQYELDIKKLESQIANSPTFSSGVRDSFQQFVANAIHDGVYPYSMLYNQVSVGPKDEVYTSIRGKLETNNINKEKELLNINIKGIFEDTNYIKLGDANIKALKEFKYDVTSNMNEYVPVVVNKFSEKFYSMKVGSTFSMHVDNKANRKHLWPSAPNNIMKFKVVGTAESYSNVEMYTLRKYANHALGLDLVNGFNGVFSNEQEPQALKNISIYSESGLYTPFDTIPESTTAENRRLIEYWLDPASGKNTLAKYQINTLDRFQTAYSKSIYTSIVNDVQWSSMSHFAFVSVNSITSDIIVLGEAVALFIAIIFIIILGSMMVDANRINIATMKVMGYRDSEIRNSFIKSFIPTMLLGIIVAIPLTFGLLAAAQLAIMAFGKVLIPMSMLGWEILTASIAVAVIFFGIFISSIRQLKGQSALAAFSSE